jgi:hypothetical protein
MQLYHFSEDGDIRVFRPHVAATSVQPEALVWAIDEWHAPMYYFPRQCPRASYWPGPQTTDEDRERWFGGIDARMVITVESIWLERIRAARLFRYTLPDSPFQLNDAIAGHWVSRQSVEPLSIEPVGDLLAALIHSNVELRVTPSLMEIWQRVIQSTLQFSGTRLRNAR